MTSSYANLASSGLEIECLEAFPLPLGTERSRKGLSQVKKADVGVG